MHLLKPTNKVLIPLIAVVFACLAASASECRISLQKKSPDFAEAKSPRVQDLDPRAILSRKGLDPDKVAFKIKYELLKNSNIPRIISFWVTYDGQRCLEMRFTAKQSFQSRQIIFQNNFTDSLKPYKGDPIFFRGKGIGTVAHLAAAKLIYDRWGTVIASDDPTEILLGAKMLSLSARAVWERFESQGLTTSGFVGMSWGYIMKPDVLGGKRFKKVKEYLETRTTDLGAK